MDPGLPEMLPFELIFTPLALWPQCRGGREGSRVGLKTPVLEKAPCPLVSPSHQAPPCGTAELGDGHLSFPRSSASFCKGGTVAQRGEGWVCVHTGARGGAGGEVQPLEHRPLAWPCFPGSRESGRAPSSGPPSFGGPAPPQLLLPEQHTACPSLASAGDPEPFCFPWVEAPLGASLWDLVLRGDWTISHRRVVSRECGPEIPTPVWKRVASMSHCFVHVSSHIHLSSCFGQAPIQVRG